MDYLQYQIPIYNRVIFFKVLNLVINGLPSILKGNKGRFRKWRFRSFKPCYKWITFNTEKYAVILDDRLVVLNLVINGLPSIQNFDEYTEGFCRT